MVARNLLDLPYEILLLIFEQLDEIRTAAAQPTCDKPPPDAHRDVWFRRTPVLAPKKFHDSPRRAEKFRIAYGPTYDSSATSKCVPKEPFISDSVFDGVSRTNKMLREMTYPFIFKNVVLASDDCLRLDALEYYSKADWILKHVRSLRVFIYYTTYPQSLAGSTPPERVPKALDDLTRLLQSIPRLERLHFLIDPRDKNTSLEKSLTPKEGEPSPFRYVKDLYTEVENEWLIPLCGTESGLEAFEYKTSYSVKSSAKVSFSTFMAHPHGAFGGMQDERAVAVLSGFQQLGDQCTLKRLTLAAFINDSGLELMAPFVHHVEELNLLYGIASSCYKALPCFPKLRKLRFGQDSDPKLAKNPHCYMPRSELVHCLTSAGKDLEVVQYQNRFVAYVVRNENGSVLLEQTWWNDLWADDKKGHPEGFATDLYK